MNEEERERPTWSELVDAVASLPPDRAARILANARPAPVRPKPESGIAPQPPRFVSWTDFLARTTPAERRRWCAKKTNTANRERLMSGRPDTRITVDDVLVVLERARGRCRYCGPLAVENRPSKANGAPAPWESVGRRVGSLGHAISRFAGVPIRWKTWCGLAFGVTLGRASGRSARWTMAGSIPMRTDRPVNGLLIRRHESPLILQGSPSSGRPPMSADVRPRPQTLLHRLLHPATRLVDAEAGGDQRIMRSSDTRLLPSANVRWCRSPAVRVPWTSAIVRHGSSAWPLHWLPPRRARWSFLVVSVSPGCASSGQGMPWRAVHSKGGDMWRQREVTTAIQWQADPHRRRPGAEERKAARQPLVVGDGRGLPASWPCMAGRRRAPR